MPTCPACRKTYPDGASVCAEDGAELLPDAAYAATDKDLAPGEMVGEYRVDAILGRGGFGTVYRAMHPVIGKPAAVKVLGRSFSSDPEMVARFVSEARAVNKIAHRNIVDIFSFGTLADGRQYYVMELLEGVELDAYLVDKGALSITEALPILRGIARAVDAAHAAGILHRDLKPANIFLCSDEDHGIVPKLLDFGIAKLLPHARDPSESSPRTQTGSPIGTPLYMSPEQCRGGTVDGRTDVYSFGVMVHEMLTGRLPFFDESNIEIMMKHLSSPPPRMSEHAARLPPALDEPVLRMLDKDPEKRPRSLGEGVRLLALAAQTLGYDVDVPPVVELKSSSGASGRQAASQSAAISSAPTIADTSSEALAAHLSGKATGKRRAILWATVGGFVLATSAGLLVALGGRASPSDSPRSNATDPIAPKRALGDAPRPEAPSPASSTVSLTVASIPESVDVYIGDRKLGTTPGPISVPRGDSSVTLAFRASGYQSKNVDFTPKDDGAISVTLTQEKRAPKAHGTHQVKDLEF